MTTRIPITIPYGAATRTVHIAADNLLGVYAPGGAPVVPDAAAEIVRALAAPIGAPTLVEAARGCRRVVIVADDNTRPTPTGVIVPLLLAALNAAGVPDDAIRVVIALGTHRPMTPDEIVAKFGQEVVRRVAVENHEAFDPAALVDLGTTPSGVPVLVNRTVMEADLVIGVGSIVPHHIPGFSGGAKIIQPGVCGERTTGEVHLLSVRREGSLLGVQENPVRAEMEVIAEQAGLRAILNTVLDTQGRLVAAVYGDPRAAFRRGVAISRTVYGVPAPERTEIVLAGSHPCDIEFWQAHKTLYAAELVVRPGGTIIIVTPCPEGVAVTHPDMVQFAGQPAEAIDAAIRAGAIRDLTAGALALAWANTRRHAAISLVSDGIADADARALGFTPYPDVQSAVDAALHRHGPRAQVAVLPHAPETLPIVPTGGV
ncbi:MAG TPA: nickel-dependent lactate racemase [Chloroflexi bacterium]|jgi:nickel-dependent lactate racemase|nr:nickel-dependent lactate racemase [Chloroflexota bacterium]